MRSSFVGGIWALISAVMWALLFPIGRYLIGNECVDPITLGAIRFSIASLILFFVALCTSGKKVFSSLCQENVRLIVAGLIGVALMTSFLFFGQKTVGAAKSSMLDALSPLLIFIFFAIKHRQINYTQGIGVLLGLLGCAMVVGLVSFDAINFGAICVGDALIFLGAICWAIYTVYGRSVIGRVGSILFTTWTMLIGSIILWCIDLGFNNEMVFPSSLLDWGLVVASSIFCTALSFFSWNQAQRYISVSYLSFFAYLIPVISGFLGFVFLGESLTIAQVVGSILVMGAFLTEKRERVAK